MRKPLLKLSSHSALPIRQFFNRLFAVVLLAGFSLAQAEEIRVSNNLDSGPGSFRQALVQAELDASISRIKFDQRFNIQLLSELTFSGKQAITIDGRQSNLDGSKIQSLRSDLMTFQSSTAVALSNFSIQNSSGSGVVVKIDPDAQGNVDITLDKGSITDAALYGLHIDDNFDSKDQGDAGSVAGIRLNISNCTIINNGNGDMDYDGIRVDERDAGNIVAYVSGSRIDHNGGDGFELDEGGDGDVRLTMIDSHLDFNGSLNPEDLDDGLDIDEAGSGDVIVTLIGVHTDSNYEEGIDLDELDSGSIELTFYDVHSDHNAREGIHVDEDESGDIIAYLSRVEVNNLGQQGIRIEQHGSGEFYSQLVAVHSTDQIYLPAQNESGSRKLLLAWLKKKIPF